MLHVKRSVGAIALSGLLTLAVAGAEPLLRTGDRIVFFGDSITALGAGPEGYVSLVVAAMTLRCPWMEVDCLANAGLPGDTAPGGLRRLQTSVLDQKPTVVTLCFGMNDARAAPYDDQTYATYMAGMSNLVVALKAAHVRAVLITSSPVDSLRAKSWFKTEADARACNVMLARMAEGLKALAVRENLAFCDVFTPMLEVQERAQKADPAFTLAPDGIHPNAMGNALMARGILKGLQITNAPASLMIDAANGTFKADQCEVSNLLVTADVVSFTRTDLAFPVFLPAQAESLSPYVPLQEEMNPYRFTVKGLKPDCNWRLCVSGTNVGTFTSAQLAAGTNLALLAGPWRDLAEYVDRLTAAQQRLGVSNISFPQRMKGWMPDEAKPEMQALLNRVEVIIREREAARKRALRVARQWNWVLTRQ